MLWQNYKSVLESSLEEDEDNSVFLVFFSDSEKSLFSLIEERFNNNEEALMSSFVISLEILLDLHIEEQTRKNFLTETKWGHKKENLISILNDDRWKNFNHPYKKWGIELCFTRYSFDILNHIMILGSYRDYRDVLMLVFRLLYVLSVQNIHHIPVNSFYKLYKTQTVLLKDSNGFVYDDIAKQIEGMVTFH